jgi:LPXTG-motif cell wall-anchored protein
VTRLRSLHRRALAVASSALLGLAGGAALIAGPAAAQASAVAGSCAWDPDTSQWVVTWTVTTDAPADADSYRLTSVEVTPDGSTLEGIEATPDAAGFPYDERQPLVGEQRLPEGSTAASLAVRAEWDGGQQDPQGQRGDVDIPADCGQPELLSVWSLDCDSLTITINNATDAAATVMVAPDAGEPVPVEVAGGGSGTVEFPPSAGLSVDVLLDGVSIVDPADPIAVSSGELAALECAEDDDGGGGGLPATGISAIIVAGGALALLSLGAGLYLVARRRRIRFTA